MYTQYYGLQAQPFRLTPDPNFYFNSATHKSALAYMRYGLQQGEGFIVVTGAAGTGKTTLALTLVGRLPHNLMEIGELVTTQLQPEDLLHAIAAAFKLDVGGLKSDLIIRLQKFFTERARAGKHVLLVVDEAHDMPQESFEELRMLSNLHRGPRALLQCILLGQPPLRDMLNRTNMEQFQQRVIAAHHLHPLSLEETRGYILHRLRQAGWRGNPSFTAEAITLIHQYTQGIPRRINALCNRLMLYDYIEEKHQIDATSTMQVYDEWMHELGQADATEVFQQPELGKITIEDIAQEHAVFKHAAGAEKFVYRANSAASANAKVKVESNEPVPTGKQATPASPLHKEATLPSSAENRVISVLLPREENLQRTHTEHLLHTFLSPILESSVKLSQNLHLYFKTSWFILPLVALILVIAITLISPVDDPGSKAIAEKATTQSQDQPSSAATEPMQVVSSRQTAVSLTSDKIESGTPLQFEQSVSKENVAPTQNAKDILSVTSTPTIATTQPTLDTHTEPIPPIAVKAAEHTEVAAPEAKPLPEPAADENQEKQAPELAATETRVTVVPSQAKAKTPSKPVEAAKPTTFTKQKPTKAEHTEMVSRSQIKKSMASVSVAYATPLPESSISATHGGPATNQSTESINTLPISDKELSTLLTRFREAYESGNIQELTSMFSSDALGDDADNRAAILRSYQKLFNLTDERKIALKNVQWRSHGKAVLGEGQFGVNVKETGRNWQSSYSGTINLRVEKRDGQLLITALSHSYAQ